MRIEREDGTPVGPAWAVATRGEAEDLLQALVLYFCDDGVAVWNAIADALPAVPDPGWHHHLGSPDELTLAIESDSAA